MLYGQRIHFKAILGNVGLFMQVPAIMAAVSILIATIFQESHAILPLLVTATVGVTIGQLLYRTCFEKHVTHLWDAMVVAALGWIACSVIGALPIYWLAKLEIIKGNAAVSIQHLATPVNALFESFSGFTSTGLTMVTTPSELPDIILWWRSLMQWTGGLGLIVFVLSLTELRLHGYHLYYAEAHTERTQKDVTKTARAIWILYTAYTLGGVALFTILKMPIWESINHAMAIISTGGFSVNETSFANYSRGIQGAGLLIMVLGSMSFILQYLAIQERSLGRIFKNWQHCLLFILLVFGSLLLWLLDRLDSSPLPVLDSVFEWFSALTTCGFSTVKIDEFGPMAKLLLVVAMTIGGCTGSTVGGIKLQRLMHLFSGIKLRVKTITDHKQKAISKEYKKLSEPAGIELPHSEKTERLYAAGVLFFLWLLTLMVGTIIMMYWVPEAQGIDALFDVISATSNVGLTSGIMGPDFHIGGKILFMILMWIGRLEIISVLILLLSIPLFLRRR